MIEWKPSEFLGPVFGRRIFLRFLFFVPPDFFADFLAGFYLLILVGKKSAQKNAPRKSPAESTKICTTKVPDISAEGPGQEIVNRI